MTRLKDGTKTHLYLLDEQLGMDKMDLISTNLAERNANSNMGLLCYKFANEYLTQTGERILLTVVIKNHIL